MSSMKKMIGLALLAGAATAGVPTIASADVAGNVAFTSNYVWRGTTQSDSAFAVQGGADYTQGIFYAGAWASSVDDFGIDASTELDLYAGITPTLGPVTLKLGVIGYLYPNTSTDSDFVELVVGGSVSPAESLTLGAYAYFSNDLLATGNESTYLEATAAYAFSDAFSVSGGFGTFDMDALGDYDTWNIGGTFRTHGFGFDLRYHDTDGLGLDEEFSFTISRAL